MIAEIETILTKDFGEMPESGSNPEFNYHLTKS